MKLNFFKKTKTLSSFALVLFIILSFLLLTLYPTPQKAINYYLTNEFNEDVNTPKFAEFKKSLASIGVTTISPELNKQQQLTSTLSLYVYSTKQKLDKNKAPQYLVWFEFIEYWKDNNIKQVYGGCIWVLLEKTSPLHWNLTITKIFPVKAADKKSGISLSP